MDRETFKELHNEALKALSEERLLDLLFCIDAMLKACPEAWSVREDFEKLNEDYDLMLSYVERGITDERRAEIYNTFLHKADFLLARTHHAYLSFSDTSYFSTIARRANDGSDAEAIFNKALVSAPYDDMEAGRIYSVISNPDTPKDIRLALISGITLSALCIYDWQKVLILARLMSEPDIDIRSRATVGFVVTALTHSDRLVRQPKIKKQISLLEQDKSALELLRIAQLQLFVCSYTKRDTKRMTEEIIPGMMNAMKDMRAKDSSVTLDDIEMELNPDWEAPENDSKIQAQMRSLIEMQERGADTFYATFSNIVRHQSFWNDAANWFVPFSEHHKAFADSPQMQKTISLLRPIFSQHSFSETDKYSLAIMFSTLPSDNMSEQLKQHLEGIDNFPPEKKSGEGDSQEDIHRAIRSSMHDIYRFLTLFRFPLPADNPFDGDLLLQKKALFSFLNSHGELTAAFANYTFREKDYARADELFRKIPPQNLQARNYEMWAATLYNLRRYDEAAECLERALLLNPDSLWSLRLLTGAYMRSARYDEALKTLYDWERLAPDDYRMLQDLGECFLHLSMHEQALAIFFKLHYLHPDSRSRRLIAWCSLLLGKLQQAESHYRQLLGENPSAEDLMNAAHCQLLQGRQDEAIKLYRQCLKAKGQTYAAPDFFSADKALLVATTRENEASLTETDLQLLRDAINRNH